MGNNNCSILVIVTLIERIFNRNKIGIIYAKIEVRNKYHVYFQTDRNKLLFSLSL